MAASPSQLPCRRRLLPQMPYLASRSPRVTTPFRSSTATGAASSNACARTISSRSPPRADPSLLPSPAPPDRRGAAGTGIGFEGMLGDAKLRLHLLLELHRCVLGSSSAPHEFMIRVFVLYPPFVFLEKRHDNIFSGGG